ncbi:MAG: MFS transporter [Actinomycetota bacterium]|nr:MFS transporter [Actinomycetota bacterium]
MDPDADRAKKDHLRRGTPELRRANLALFVAGLATFAMLYCTQPLLPTFSAEFGVTPAVASLSLSVTTATLAGALILAGSFSEAWGRTTMMTASLVFSSLLMVLAAFSPGFAALLVLRAAQGVALAGLPAVAMAYLAEEVHPKHAGFTIGLYIAGNSVGGLAGRVISGALADAFSWRMALGSLGLACVLASLVFWLILPGSTRFEPRPLVARNLLASLGAHLKDRGLVGLYAVGALLMGGFVALYNYVGYHLLGAPYGLSQTEVGWIFVLYLVGTFSSAWMGRLADRFGRGRVLWIAILLMLGGVVTTLAGNLAVIVVGVAVLTFGFFGAHSIASGWVGQRALAAKAQASALYLLCYYLGSSIGGSAGGLAYSYAGWPGLVAMVAGLLILALIPAARLTLLRNKPGHSRRHTHPLRG